MIRALGTLALVVTLGAVAVAAPKRKVRIETQPEGATVYIEDKENGPACEGTPCAVELPVGESSLIIELEGYDPKFTTVNVPRRGAAKVDTLTLDKAIGTLSIQTPVGATVTIDDEEVGTVPFEQEVPAGTHAIVVAHRGKKTAPAFVDVPSGSVKEFEPSFEAASAPGPEEGVGEPGEGGEAAAKVTTTAAPARAPFLRLSLAGDLGYRNFTYGTNTSAEFLRTETENGAFLLGPVLELWPGVLAGVRALRGLSILARYQGPAYKLSVTATDIAAETTTFWQSYEVSARQKWIVMSDKLGVELGAGYVRDQFQYNARPTDKDKLPDVDYSVVRIGAKLSYLRRLSERSTFEPFLAGEFRIVRDGGAVQSRFGTGSSASGMRAALGAVLVRGKLSVRAEAALVRYTWDLTPNGDLDAESAVDRIIFLGFSLGYAL